MCCVNTRVAGSLLCSLGYKGQNLVPWSHSTVGVVSCAVLCVHAFIHLPPPPFRREKWWGWVFLLLLCLLSVPLIICCLFSCRWVMPGLHSTYRHLSQQPYRHVQAFQWGSCLTSILLANCKAWTQGKNETEICVITTLCQHILHKLQTSESLTLALNVSHWRVLGLKFEKGQHSTFCIWSAPEPTGLWQAVPPVEHLASSDLTRTTPCPNHGFSMRRNLKFFHAMKTGWLYQY